MFYKYLLISPSYRLAYRQLFLKETIPDFEIPDEFEAVLEICRRAGNIYELSFDDWWDEFGIKLLSADKRQRFLPYKIDLSLNKREIMLDFESYLDGLIALPYIPEKIQISFLDYQIRSSTLQEIWNRVDHRATILKWDAMYGFPKTPYWKMEAMVGNELDLDPTTNSSSKIADNLKKYKKRKKRIAYLTMLWSKRLKEGLYISENAARGRFPCKEPIKNCPKFDLTEIEKIITVNINLTIESDKKRNAQGLDPYIHLFSREGRRAYKRKKIKEVQDKKIEMLAEKKARQKLNDPDYE